MTATTEPKRPGVPPLSKPEKALLGSAAGLGVGVGGVGLASSFDTVSAAGARWGFAIPQMLPIGIDTAIPVFTAVNLLLIRMDMPLAWVRWVPWGLTGVTCWLNVAAGRSLSAEIAHGTMPLLWVVLSEVAAHVYATRIGAVTGRRMERIRRSRWLLAFPSTFLLWRRMTLWEVTSYAEALACERERLLVRADLRERYGRRWRRKAPRRTRVLLKLGELAPVRGRAEGVQLPAHAPEPTPLAAPEAPRPAVDNPQVARRTPPVQSGQRTPASRGARAAAAETARRAQFEEAEMERTRQDARRTYAESLEAGHPIGPKALGEAYGFSEAWGRKQIKAVHDGRRHGPLMAVGAGSHR